MSQINPFKPNSPVPTAMFAGRYDELLELEKGLHQTKNEFCSNYLISGERGIGKSSLMMFLKHISCGDITSIEHGTFNFITVNIILSDKTDLITMIKLIERNISREVGKHEVVRNFLKETWSFVQRIKVMDSGIGEAENDAEADILIDSFAYSLSETCKRITNPEKGEVAKEGIIFLIDEADNASDDLRIGYFFKTVTELLQQNGCNNIMFVVAGLPEVVEKLSKSHESSVRIFNQLKIKELSTEDRKYVVKKGLEKGNELNTQKITINKDAEALVASLSEGYPHFVQQFAYSAFDYNSDDKICQDDVLEAAFNVGGAIDAIGNKYYANSFFDKIKSDEYRQVLHIMAKESNSWVTKKQIRDKFTGDETTLTNALKALTSRKIILKNPSKVGEYRLQQKGFALWIRLFGNRKK